MNLPDLRNWKADAKRGPWFSLRHAPSQSVLRFGFWRASRVNSLAECARDARRAEPEFGLDQGDSSTERSRITSLSGFQAELTLATGLGQGTTVGRAVLVATRPGACFAALYSTEVSGRGGLRTALERVTFIADHTLTRVRFRSIEERVRPNLGDDDATR